MTTGVGEAIYKLWYFIFLSMKKHREKAKNTGKRQGILSWSERGNPDYVEYWHRVPCPIMTWKVDVDDNPVSEVTSVTITFTDVMRTFIIT